MIILFEFFDVFTSPRRYFYWLRKRNLHDSTYTRLCIHLVRREFLYVTIVEYSFAKPTTTRDFAMDNVLRVLNTVLRAWRWYLNVNYSSVGVRRSCDVGFKKISRLRAVSQVINAESCPRGDRWNCFLVRVHPTEAKSESLVFKSTSSGTFAIKYSRQWRKRKCLFSSWHKKKKEKRNSSMHSLSLSPSSSIYLHFLFL